jgi:hypothetical protein
MKTEILRFICALVADLTLHTLNMYIFGGGCVGLYVFWLIGAIVLMI